MAKDGKARAKYLKPKRAGCKGKPRPLSPREALFVEAYLGAGRMRIGNAAIMAGFTPTYGSKVIRRPHVHQAIVERLKDMKLGKDEVHVMLSDIARASMEDFLDIEERDYPVLDPHGNPIYDEKGKPLTRKQSVFFFNLQKAKERGKLHLVKLLGQSSKGDVKIELHDAKAALDSIARIHGMFTDNVNVAPASTPEDIWIKMVDAARTKRE